MSYSSASTSRGFDALLMPKVIQVKISLIGILPTIWRRIQVPMDFGFFAFHSAIQDAFKWEGQSVFSFEMFSRRPDVKPIGLPFHDGALNYERDSVITTYFTCEGDTAFYIYDDQWPFYIVLERVIDRAVDIGYPTCIYGQRCCANENVDGFKGYRVRLRIAADPDDRLQWYHAEMLADMGHSDAFNSRSVEFDDPKGRFKAFANKL